MLAVALGLLSSLCWGTSDFIGGLQSRRVPQLGVMLLAQLVGAAAIAVVVVVSGAARPSATHLLEGTAGGLAGTAALFAFYRGLAVGAMSVVAPIAATGAAVPVIFGIAKGEAPGALRLLGIAVAVVGVVLVSCEGGGEGGEALAAAARARVVRTSVLLALVAALGFGGFFVGVHEAATGDPLWAVLAARAAGTVLVTLIALPFLARGVRVRRVQELGIAAALGGVVLIAAG